MSNRKRISLIAVLAIQMMFAAAFLFSWFLLPAGDRHRIQAELQSSTPLAEVEIENVTPVTPLPLYDDPEVISDEDLAFVLHAVLPRFSQQKLRPNYVEHAVRAWGSEVEFRNEALISGPQMVDYLLDTGAYVA